MKKVLLLAAAAMVMTSASAQLKVSAPQKVARPETREIPAPKHVSMQMRTPGAPVVKAPKRVEYHDLYYNRPAGMYPGTIFMAPDGTSDGIAFAPYFAAKPYCTYTFEAIYDAETPETTYEWDVQNYNETEHRYEWETLYGKKIDYYFNFGVDSVPVVYAFNGDQMEDLYFSDGHYQGNQYSAHIMFAPSASAIFSDVEEGGAILVSSKNFCWGGFQNDQDVPFTYISGADPYGDQEEGGGYWFGKNGGAGKYRVDGIAQAFEKPRYPYLLKRIVLDVTELEVLDQVDMTCKIYKLDGIPAYDEKDEAVLPDEPGELIATGRATLTPESGELIVFTIYEEEDGLELEYTPTIDSDILVVIDGYNDPEMENLHNFSAMISSDTGHDEGFGELAYLKFGVPDEDGNLDHYVWAGLNNFFGGDHSAMKTGFSIMLDIENPYLKFYFDEENGEYEFPVEGGKLEKTFDGQTIDAIVFESWEPSVDDAWTMTCNGGDVPSWLNITLEDNMTEEGEYSGIVFGEVTAEPLPAGVKYREAVVRFEYPGTYVDYKFTQGEKPIGLYGDVNGDGAVNIADINEVIDMILAGTYKEAGDVNGDGAVNIGDINTVIAIILK